MYILFESSDSSKTISEASIFSIDIMGYVETENEAMEWREKNIDYRDYKYMRYNKEE